MAAGDSDGMTLRTMQVATTWTMVSLRVVLCPMIVWGAHADWDGHWLALIVLVALIDDIFDGVLARRWGCDTPALRLSDTVADTIFYLGVAIALWMREPQLLRGNWQLLAALFVTEAMRYGFDFWKFGKSASYHTYLAKCWGLVMAVAVIGVLSFSGLQWLIPVSLILGIACNTEGLAMSVVLPRWKNDVKTLAMAWRLRKTMTTPAIGE